MLPKIVLLPRTQCPIPCNKSVDQIIRHPNKHPTNVVHSQNMALTQKLKAYRANSEENSVEDQLQAVRRMSLSELEKEVIQFGKAKLGQPFSQVFEDNKWTDWFVGAYESSTKIEHVKFVTYVSKRLDAEIENDMQGKIKGSKIKKQPMSSKTKPEIKTETAWASELKVSYDDVESETDEFIPIHASPQNALMEEQISVVQEENHNLRNRMTQIEMAIQELIVHVKSLSPN